jgi:hypothetical protein
MDRVPRITCATPIGPTQLLVVFDEGSQLAYDCGPLLARPQFQLLKNPAFFRAVRVDPGGYGISWNDEIDLSEYELWTNGRRANTESQPPVAAGEGTGLESNMSPSSSSQRGIP